MSQCEVSVCNPRHPSDYSKALFKPVGRYRFLETVTAQMSLSQDCLCSHKTAALGFPGDVLGGSPHFPPGLTVSDLPALFHRAPHGGPEAPCTPQHCWVPGRRAGGPAPRPGPTRSRGELACATRVRAVRAAPQLCLRSLSKGAVAPAAGGGPDSKSTPTSRA